MYFRLFSWKELNLYCHKYNRTNLRYLKELFRNNCVGLTPESLFSLSLYINILHSASICYLNHHSHRAALLKAVCHWKQFRTRVIIIFRMFSIGYRILLFIVTLSSTYLYRIIPLCLFISQHILHWSNHK